MKDLQYNNSKIFTSCTIITFLRFVSPVVFPEPSFCFFHRSVITNTTHSRVRSPGLISIWKGRLCSSSPVGVQIRNDTIFRINMNRKIKQLSYFRFQSTGARSFLEQRLAIKPIPLLIVSFRGQIKLYPRPHWSSFRG